MCLMKQALKFTFACFIQSQWSLTFFKFNSVDIYVYKLLLAQCIIHDLIFSTS